MEFSAVLFELKEPKKWFLCRSLKTTNLSHSFLCKLHSAMKMYKKYSVSALCLILFYFSLRLRIQDFVSVVSKDHIHKIDARQRIVNPSLRLAHTEEDRRLNRYFLVVFQSQLSVCFSLFCPKTLGDSLMPIYTELLILILCFEGRVLGLACLGPLAPKSHHWGTLTTFILHVCRSLLQVSDQDYFVHVIAT